MEQIQLFNWPGKSAQLIGGIQHPAVLHMLDVAAVAERLIAPFHYDAKLRDALVLLVALHDLGKISDSFRAMIEDGASQRFRHWQLTEVLLFAHDGLLSSRIGGSWRQRQALYASVAGHHGQPSDLTLGGQPGLPGHSQKMREGIHAIGSGLDVAASVIDAFCALWPAASLAPLTAGAPTTALSWWLPGLCAAADWVGSNTAWFPAEGECRDLGVYLEKTRRRALEAVNQAGLAGAEFQTGPTFDFALRPMQAACEEVTLPEGPMLAIIEDETGAGKTEAALILAHRMLQAGKARGIYFALPTMATADAMFNRAKDAINKIFKGPTLTLAHGRAGLSDTFKDLTTGGSQGEDTPSCTGWLMESRRRALLADVGVGTVDQALLAALPVKHQTLRHFGLSSKVLIVDEVHEMGEPYIGCELERLLQMHRAAGASAILLTATLPMNLRARLLATYHGENHSLAYPALTIAGGAARDSFAADNRAVKGRVRVERIESAAAAVDLLAAEAGKGAACVWVRNSVDDAITAQEALHARGIAAQILHARFALSDRKRIEAEILARVGKDGTGREGFVLVGTQVLESSLDLDFDMMVSDIAPIAALIQRAGRLWRHMGPRPATTRPTSAPVLHVLSPDATCVTDEHWLKSTLDRGAYVYSLPDVWRSARVLFAAGQIDAPDGLRALIEAVHGEEADILPEALQSTDIRALGEAAASRTLASHNLVELAAGYRAAGKGDDDVKYPTRLGAETRTLVLARRVGDALHPWAIDRSANDPDPLRAWSLSEVSAATHRFAQLQLPDQARPDIASIIQDWPTWKRNGVTLCPVETDGKICEGLRYDEKAGLQFRS